MDNRMMPIADHTVYQYDRLKSMVLGSDQRSGSDRRSIIPNPNPTTCVTNLTWLTLPDLNLSIFPWIPCLVSGRRSEPIIIQKIYSLILTLTLVLIKLNMKIFGINVTSDKHRSRKVKSNLFSATSQAKPVFRQYPLTIKTTAKLHAQYHKNEFKGNYLYQQILRHSLISIIHPYPVQ